MPSRSLALDKRLSNVAAKAGAYGNQLRERVQRRADTRRGRVADLARGQLHCPGVISRCRGGDSSAAIAVNGEFRHVVGGRNTRADEKRRGTLGRSRVSGKRRTSSDAAIRAHCLSESATAFCTEARRASCRELHLLLHEGLSGVAGASAGLKQSQALRFAVELAFPGNTGLRPLASAPQ